MPFISVLPSPLWTIPSTPRRIALPPSDPELAFSARKHIFVLHFHYLYYTLNIGEN